MDSTNWPQAFIWAAAFAAMAYAVSQMAGCAQHMRSTTDVQVECAKQHGQMSWGYCTFPSEVKK